MNLGLVFIIVTRKSKDIKSNKQINSLNIKSLTLYCVVYKSVTCSEKIISLDDWGTFLTEKKVTQVRGATPRIYLKC